jgi:hypothetical protein
MQPAATKARCPWLGLIVPGKVGGGAVAPFELCSNAPMSGLPPADSGIGLLLKSSVTSAMGVVQDRRCHGRRRAPAYHHMLTDNDSVSTSGGWLASFICTGGSPTGT